MNLKKLFDDDKAVSPVIGVILMVAITVILAAVIASFVLGLGNQTGPAAPTVSISCDLDNSQFVHEGGDTINTGNLIVRNSGSSGTSGDIQAGDTFGTAASDSVLVWQNPESDSTSILHECWYGLSTRNQFYFTFDGAVPRNPVAAGGEYVIAEGAMTDDSIISDSQPVRIVCVNPESDSMSILAESTVTL